MFGRDDAEDPWTQVHLVRGVDVGWQCEAGEVDIVDACSFDSRGQVRIVDPELYALESLCQHDCQRSAPTASAQDADRYLRHSNLFSVPFLSRSIFDAWRQAMKSPAMVAASKMGQAG